MLVLDWECQLVYLIKLKQLSQRVSKGDAVYSYLVNPSAPLLFLSANNFSSINQKTSDDFIPKFSFLSILNKIKLIEPSE